MFIFRRNFHSNVFRIGRHYTIYTPGLWATVQSCQSQNAILLIMTKIYTNKWKNNTKTLLLLLYYMFKLIIWLLSQKKIIRHGWGHKPVRVNEVCSKSNDNEWIENNLPVQHIKRLQSRLFACRWIVSKFQLWRCHGKPSPECLLGTRSARASLNLSMVPKWCPFAGVFIRGDKNKYERQDF